MGRTTQLSFLSLMSSSDVHAILFLPRAFLAVPASITVSINSFVDTDVSNNTIDFPLIIVLAIAFISALIAVIAVIFLYSTQLKTQRHRLKEQSIAENLRQTQYANELLRNYRRALRSDPQMTFLTLQSQPLELLRMYVNLRLYRRTLFEYDLDDGYATPHDPYELLWAGRCWHKYHTCTTLNPDQAIRMYRHCVILSDAGAGKTTLLRYLALQSVNRQLSGLSDLPIYIELGPFVHSRQGEPLSFAAERWSAYGISRINARSSLEKNLQAGNILLLLDGLDETHVGKSAEAAEAAYLRVLHAVEQIAATYPQAFIVVTTRNAVYRQLPSLKGFTELELLDFRQQDIEQFVCNWYACRDIPVEHAEELNSALRQNLRLRKMTSNPLMLSLLVSVYQEALELPESWASLYASYVTSLFSRMDAARSSNSVHILEQEGKLRLLAFVAWHFHNLRQVFFHESDVLEVIARFFREEGISPAYNYAMLRILSKEEGWLRQHPHGLHCFTHLAFQEYFAARYLVNKVSIALKHVELRDPWWERVVLFYVASLDDIIPFLLMLDKYDDDEQEYHQLEHQERRIFAGRCMAVRGTLLVGDLEERLLFHLLDLLVSTPYLLLAQKVAETLISIDEENINHCLLALLSERNIDQKKQLSIVWAMETARNPFLLRSLLALLGDETISPLVRVNIAQVLGRVGERTQAHQLVELLVFQHLHSDVRTSVAIALGQLEEPSVAYKLVALLSNRQLDVSVRVSITEALGVLGEHTGVVADLLQFYANAQLEFVLRCYIAIALGHLGEFSVVASLIPLLSNGEYSLETRIEIANALGTLAIRSLAFDLLPLLSNELIPWEVRTSIAFALERLGEHAIVPQLLQLLADEKVHHNVRLSICTILNKLTSRSVLPRLKELHIDVLAEKRLYRSWYVLLGLLGERIPVHHFIVWLEDEEIHPCERLYMLEALSTLREGFVVFQLLILLSLPDLHKKVRQGIITTLVILAQNKVVPEEIIPKLVNFFSETNTQKDILYMLWNLKYQISN